MSVTSQEVQKALSGVLHPEVGRAVTELNMIEQLQVEGGKVSFTLAYLTWASPVKSELLDAVSKAVMGLAGVEEVDISTRVEQRSTQPALGGGLLESVKNVLAVASGKGGVGKSTVATNIAAALADEGARVGLMDADIYGPSVPALLGIDRSQLTIREKRILPPERYGLKVMSMGFLMRPGESVIWRGPMLHGMMNQFCKDVEWGELDFLVVDLPPGTGDVSLSLSQLVPIGGTIIVSTPQDLALGVATKAVNMFEKLNVPVVGLVENMSFYCCPQCGHRDELFGHGGARRSAQELGIPFLGEVPLNGLVRQAGDSGQPVVLASPESAPALALRRIAQLAAGRLAVAAESGYDKLCENLPALI